MKNYGESMADLEPEPAVLFETDGLIDIRAFTTMGLSAKPMTESPIGYFGTGLKYAMAVLVRLGMEPIVWIGKDKYTFRKVFTDFRGQGFDLLQMEVHKFRWLKSRFQDLPFTTQYGRNWELWMAFRELESNTRDEKGSTKVTRYSETGNTEGENGKTKILIRGQEIVDIFEKIGEIFLEGALREPLDNRKVQIFPGESQFIYWRGLKVLKPFHPTLHTYNFLGHLDLTEDRTIAWEYQAKQLLADDLVKSTNQEFIKKVLTCDEKHWEHGMDMPYYEKPSQAFRQVMYSNPARMNSKASDYLFKHEPSQVLDLKDNPDPAYPTPWRLDAFRILDAKGNTVFECPAGSKQGISAALPQKRWTTMAEHVIELMNEDSRDDDVPF